MSGLKSFVAASFVVALTVVSSSHANAQDLDHARTSIAFAETRDSVKQHTEQLERPSVTSERIQELFSTLTAEDIAVLAANPEMLQVAGAPDDGAFAAVLVLILLLPLIAIASV